MKLQLSMDLIRAPEALKMVEQIQDVIDIVEIGTPMIVREGMAPVMEIRKQYPDLVLLADTKIVAAGAKKAGAKLALITGNPHSTLGKLADFPVTIAAPTPNLRTNDGKVPTVQPGASAFEQSVLLLTDSLIMDLSAGQDLAQRNREIMRHHANLE